MIQELKYASDSFGYIRNEIIPEVKLNETTKTIIVL